MDVRVRTQCLMLMLLAISILSEARAQVPDGRAVTAANLLANERLWPYHVTLVDPWKPAASEQPLRAGTRGVLIRVEASGLARIDFGRWGLYDVPVGKTDLLASANRIRSGELPKGQANFVTAIGPRLLDSAATPVQLFDVEQMAGQRAFVCVFADPNAEGFRELAQALSPLRARDGVLTILFPQSGPADGEVAERLRALKWTVPFVFDRLAEPYAETLLPAKTPPPAVLLQTSEGRLVFSITWTPSVLPRLTAALEQAFPDKPAAPSPSPAPDPKPQ